MLTGLFLNLHFECVHLWFCGARLWRSTQCGLYRQRPTKHITQLRFRESKDIKGQRHSVAGGKTKMFGM